MKIAVQGCAHGDLDDIYASVRHIEETENVKVDLLISCGDFQAVRNESDLDSMAVPQKYKQLGCFHKYYSGEMEAPYPTLFSTFSLLVFIAQLCWGVFYLSSSNH